jgi:hypothetical protein
MSQSFDTERELTLTEIRERTEMRERLDDERDALLAAIEDRRREVRGFTAKRKKIESQLRDVRRELRTGKMFESPQTSLALDLQPPIDPFTARYPIARDHETLHGQLAVVLQGVLVPSIEKLERWATSTGIFHGVANWARTELAYLNAKEHPDLTLPPRNPMPRKLLDLRIYLGKAADKSRKALQPRQAKTRPAGGTPIAKQRRRK